MAGRDPTTTEANPNAFTPEQLTFIRRRRRELGMDTDSDLARAMGASHATVSKWFTRERGASPQTARKLAEALQLPWPATFTPADLGPAHAAGMNGTGGNGRGQTAAPATAQEAARAGVALYPVYPWGGTSDLRLVGTPQQPLPATEYAPYPEEATRLHPDGFGLFVRGSSLAGRDPAVLDGDVCWVVPQRRRPAPPDSLVAARVWPDPDAPGEETGNVIRVLGRDDEGRDALYSHPAGAAEARPVRGRWVVLGPVIKIGRAVQPG